MPKAMPCSAGRFVGTSNVYLAMKYDMTPVGTMAHEFVCAIAGMYGPQMSNHIAMENGVALTGGRWVRFYMIHTAGVYSA